MDSLNNIFVNAKGLLDREVAKIKALSGLKWTNCKALVVLFLSSAHLKYPHFHLTIPQSYCFLNY